MAKRDPIQLFKPRLDWEAIGPELAKIVETGWIGLGPKTQEFEKEFAKYVGCKYVVALNSCTAALHLSYIVAGIGECNLVMTTPMTFISTNQALLYQRAYPVFIDIDPETFNMDLDLLEEELDSNDQINRVRAIVVVHYGGNPLDVERLYNMADRKGLWVIEDAAHAAGAIYKNGFKVGCNKYHRGLTCFSFHAVKNLGIGDGGAICTNDEEVYERLKRLRWLGIDKSTFVRTEAAKDQGYNWEYDVVEVGYKYHMNDISAVIALSQLKVLNSDNARRYSMTQLYKEYLDEAERFSYLEAGEMRSSNHIFAIKVDAYERNKLIEYLNKKRIFPGVHYYPNHLYPFYREFRRGLPVAEAEWKRIISLPMHLGLNDDDIQRTAEAINGYFTGKKDA